MPALALVLALLAGCAGSRPSPQLPVPEPEPGRVALRAMAGAPLGTVQPVALAVTNGGPGAIRLDARQIYASGPDGERIAPLAPAEAARRAPGERVPGAVRGGVTGAATGGVLGAIGGAVSGAIRGSIGAAVAAGTAVGAVLGAITGALGGGRARADVAGFEDRALQSTTLAPEFSATGYLYYPSGRYETLELVLTDEDTRAAIRRRVPVEPAP
jgi:hypothetical protein